MALIIEDGTGKTDSQSYATETELTEYATARGLTVSGTASELLIKAMDYAETLDYRGQRASKEQALEWPRVRAIVDGFRIEDNEIPDKLKTAQIVTALAIDAGNDPLAVIPRGVKREKVDTIEVEYSDTAATREIDPSISRAYAPLIVGGSGMGVVNVARY